MPRKAVLTGGRKDAIISAALKLFLKNGYEGTSVRMILDAVGGEVGMFYHYFPSKDAVFEAAVNFYMRGYADFFNAIAVDRSIPLSERYHMLMQRFKGSIREYIELKNTSLHWSVLTAMHQRTMQEVQPSIVRMIAEALELGVIQNPLGLPAESLASFLLYGIAGILYEKPFEELSDTAYRQKQEAILAMVEHVLGVEPGVLQIV
ncbi:MAG: TetR/AcrR family transcriptional regulator [Eubacteriales bacterium]|nr:TetR/AcrR family transcriptional regulator [Eubacteriales bacterium]